MIPNANLFVIIANKIKNGFLKITNREHEPYKYYLIEKKKFLEKARYDIVTQPPECCYKCLVPSTWVPPSVKSSCESCEVHTCAITPSGCVDVIIDCDKHKVSFADRFDGNTESSRKIIYENVDRITRSVAESRNII